MPILRRLLAALVVTAGCVVLGPGGMPAAAAPCRCGDASATVQDHLEGASAVFAGAVVDVAAGSDGATRTASVRVTTVYQPRTYRVVTTEAVEVVTPAAGGPTDGDCPVDLQVGQTYLFFVSASDAGLSATGCGGTALATAKLTTQVERLRGTGRSPVPPQPETATLTPVTTEQPASLTRVAAPGIALVIVGLLGLAVVRRLGRRG